ncbi:MAG: hypothetical protein GY765_10040 [bacterium]|nr:hypothetical protein [bacterium]
MNINESLNALQSISAEFNKIPGRINTAINDPETAKEGLEQPLTDMIVNKHAYTANVKAIREMTTVEDILLKEIRD